MTIETSHGKARPTLPRASDIPEVPPAPDPRRGRDANGRFASGNKVGSGRHWAQMLKRQLAREATGPLKAEVEALAREAFALFKGFLRELPSDGASVRALVASRARAAVLSARYGHRAAEIGLDTPDGRAAMDLSIKLDQRAERLAVTSLDVAIKLAARSPKGEDDLGALLREAAKPRGSR